MTWRDALVWAWSSMVWICGGLRDLGELLWSLLGSGTWEVNPGSRPSPSPARLRYTTDWSGVAHRLKRAQGWTCQACQVYCGAEGDRGLLHVHHRNLDSTDNHHANLICLCVQCHGAQPGVGHKRLAGAAKTDGRWEAVDSLRSRQR